MLECNLTLVDEDDRVVRATELVLPNDGRGAMLPSGRLLMRIADHERRRAVRYSLARCGPDGLREALAEGNIDLGRRVAEIAVPVRPRQVRMSGSYVIEAVLDGAPAAELTFLIEPER